MRTAVWIAAVVGTAFLAAQPATAEVKLSQLILAGTDIPAGCQAIDGEFPVDVQTAVLYDYSAYDGFLPSLKAKAHQSFDCRGDKGTVYFFEYANAADRQRAEGFVRPVLWGPEGEPTALHPAQVLKADNVLIVVSFRKLPRELALNVGGKIAKAEAGGGEGQTPPDIDDGVLDSYARRLSCVTPPSEEKRVICEWLDAFRRGNRSDSVLLSAELFIGTSRTLDGNTAIVQSHYEVLVPIPGKGGIVGFFAIRPDNEDEERQVHALIDARKAKRELPRNDGYRFIQQLAQSDRKPISATKGQSWFVLTESIIKVYLRELGGTIYFVSPVGGTPQAQAERTFMVGVLY